MTEEKENCIFQQNYNVFGLEDKPCCYLYHKYCDEIDSCYFKRCEQLKQENKELKQQLSEIGKNWGEIEELRKQVGSKQQYEITMEYDKYKTALEEISSLIDKIHYRPVAKMKEIQELIKNVLNP